MPKSGFIAIVGRPNSGKSTLLNSVLKTEISIVTPKAQTTRDQILGILTEPSQGQIVFIDTPGLHRAREGGINQYMVQQALNALEAPHLIWYLVDPSSGPQFEKPVIELIAQSIKSASPKDELPSLFLVLNKIDFARSKKIPPERLDTFEKEIIQNFQELGIPVQKSYKISALKGEGVSELLKESWARLPEGPFYYPDPDQVSDRPTRFFVAEKIREQILRYLGEEIPYSCAVEITSFDESGKLPRIEATIHVERESQKGMVIGNKGHKIKEIGLNARVEIEEFLGQKVFLGLKVDLLKNWTSDPKALRKMGYDLPKGKQK